MCCEIEYEKINIAQRTRSFKLFKQLEANLFEFQIHSDRIKKM